MRIIGGAFRGRRLAPAPRSGLRPTADPVREALFNILAAEVPGRGFVDLCAGTGAVGLEALSRGADPVWLVERSRAAVKTIRKNVEYLGPELLGGPAYLVTAEVGAWIERGATPELEDRDVSTIFIDPPYGEPRLDSWLAALGRAGWLAGETLVVVEHRRGEAPGGPGLETQWSRRYGDTELTAFRRR
jgi:16S rRNA (guanine966-N2)-methyltransferase